MKKVYFDKSEEEYLLIKNVLDKYCVPFSKTRHATRGMFYENITYDITTDLSVEKVMTLKDGTKVSPRDFIIGEVEKIIGLQNSYKMSSVQHPKTVQEKQKELKRQQIEIEKNRNANQRTILEEIERFSKKAEKKPSLKERIKNFWLNLFSTQKEETDSLSSMLDMITPLITKSSLPITPISKEELKKKSKQHSDNIPSPFNILKDVQGERVYFNDLPMEIKDVLCSQFPKELLESDKCIILRQGNAISVMING